MAENKKPPAPAVHQSDEKTIGQIAFLLALILALSWIVATVTGFVGKFDFDATESLRDSASDYFSNNVWPKWKLVSGVLSGLAFLGIVYNSRRLSAMKAEEQTTFGLSPDDESDVEMVELKNERWEKILAYTHSNNLSDWRQAIIEADVMLEELLRTLGYVGDSVGEMLKSVDKNEFNTIEDAWQAHKVRNRVAHSGGDFKLNSHETKNTIALFEKVFREFQVI